MQGLARYALEILVRLSDSYIIPYDIITYGEAITNAQSDFETVHGDLLKDNGINLGKYSLFTVKILFILMSAINITIKA